MKKFERELFTSLRVVAIKGNDNRDFLCDRTVCEALEANQYLIDHFGITMNPRGIVAVAKNNAAEALIKKVHEIFELEGKMARAKAMYNPEEVRDISELQYRMHQMIHYFSTYGIEDLTDSEVMHGWLPAENGVTEDAEKIEEDDALVEATVFDIIYDSEKYAYTYKKIVGHNNRATIGEQYLLEMAFKHLDLDVIRNTKVRFKENSTILFKLAMDIDDREKRLAILQAICQNSGDALKGIHSYLKLNKWHLSTSKKRTLVKLLESYKPADLENNLMYSSKRREKNLVLLQYLDFNTYSRSAEHAEVVRALRNGELTSFEGEFKGLLGAGKRNEALALMATRPGMVIRSLNYLLKNGISEGAIINALEGKAGSLSLQTLVENLNKFASANLKENLVDNQESLVRITKALIKANLAGKETPLKEKKVFIDYGQFAPENSVIRFNSKSGDSDFVASGLAVKLPLGDTSCYRTFLYWEDAINPEAPRYNAWTDESGTRVDMDLHAFALDKNGNPIHVGWNSDFRSKGIVMSGDVTHSHPYGCEYIDVDRNADVKHVLISFHSFTGQTFDNVRNLHVGILPVSKLGLKSTKSLYSVKNCIYNHDIKSHQTAMGYAVINFEEGYLKFIGDEREFSFGYSRNDFEGLIDETAFSLQEYIDILVDAQNAILVDSPEDADCILKLTKASSEKEISLIDENYFAD